VKNIFAIVVATGLFVPGEASLSLKAASLVLEPIFIEDGFVLALFRSVIFWFL
jgi:hypothetical protein